LKKSTARRDEIHKFSIYPEDLRAKVYELKDSHYDKVGDFLEDEYIFDNTTCKVSLDFTKVFGRFK
jgi:hypothetical protein